jgi:hypothetical protein
LVDGNSVRQPLRSDPIYFSQKTLDDIIKNYTTVVSQSQKLMEAYLLRAYATEGGREYAVQGFARRISLLARCIRMVFEAIPPQQDGFPDKDQLHNAEIHIQAFVFNLFGAIDNLAWVWNFERLTKADGSRLNKNKVGLRKKDAALRETMSPEFNTYLDTLDKWFDLLVDFRDALAHRVPLYVPPYGLSPSKADAFNKLELQMNDAMKARDYATYDLLSAEQKKLVRFQPLMMHSLKEDSKLVPFHIQMLADFLTIDQLGWKMLDELNRGA